MSCIDDTSVSFPSRPRPTSQPNSTSTCVFNYLRRFYSRPMTYVFLPYQYNTDDDGYGGYDNGDNI